ncbi:unnamed protein product [Ixodes persulcatus]
MRTDDAEASLLAGGTLRGACMHTRRTWRYTWQLYCVSVIVIGESLGCLNVLLFRVMPSFVVPEAHSRRLEAKYKEIVENKMLLQHSQPHERVRGTLFHALLNKNVK